jgi:D-sedoheptulose 7-phosphate isomerase
MNDPAGSVAKSLYGNYYRDLAMALASLDQNQQMRFADTVVDVYRDDGSVLAIGNGGSASTANHLICDLTKTARPRHGRALRAMALTEPALVTAYANDGSFAGAFGEQVAAQARPRDCLVAISASGESPNILNALQVARDRGIRTVGLFGRGGRHIANHLDTSIVVDSSHPGVIETSHLAVVHVVTALVGHMLDSIVAAAAR